MAYFKDYFFSIFAALLLPFYLISLLFVISIWWQLLDQMRQLSKEKSKIGQWMGPNGKVITIWIFATNAWCGWKSGCGPVFWARETLRINLGLQTMIEKSWFRFVSVKFLKLRFAHYIPPKSIYFYIPDLACLDIVTLFFKLQKCYALYWNCRSCLKINVLRWLRWLLHAFKTVLRSRTTPTPSKFD